MIAALQQFAPDDSRRSPPLWCRQGRGSPTRWEARPQRLRSGTGASGHLRSRALAHALGAWVTRVGRRLWPATWAGFRFSRASNGDFGRVVPDVGGTSGKRRTLPTFSHLPRCWRRVGLRRRTGESS
jgi:hypothetical protein